MKQQSFATVADQSAGFERYRKPTRRDEFLATIASIVARNTSRLVATAVPLVPDVLIGRHCQGLLLHVVINARTMPVEDLISIALAQ